MASRTKVKDGATSPEVQEPPTPLQKVVNYPVTIKAFGRKYEVKEFTMGPLVRALPHIAPLGYLMRSIKPEEGLDQNAAMFVNALHLAGGPALGLISVATNEPIEWLEDKDPIEGAELLVAIVEANVDYFFHPEKLARLKAAGARLRSIIRKHGGVTSTT